MDDERCWYYRGYVLMSEAAPRANGAGFRAIAAVVPYGRLDEAVIADSPEDLLLISEDAAVAYGREWATEWVDGLLGPPKSRG